MDLSYMCLLLVAACGAALGQGGFGGFRRQSEPSAYLETPQHEAPEGTAGYSSPGHDAAKYLVRKAEYHGQDGLYGEDGRFYRQAGPW